MVVAVPAAIATIVPAVVLETNSILITADVVAGIVRATIIIVVWAIILAIVVRLHAVIIRIRAVVAVLQASSVTVEMNFLIVSFIITLVARTFGSICIQ